MAIWGEKAGGLDDVLLAGEDAEAPTSADVKVHGLTYTIPGSKKKAPSRTVLSGVTCEFPAGKLSAIMGASGSGKTSLLTLIRGFRAPGSQVNGDIMCNGRCVDVEFMRSIASIVPQEDIFLSALTVREMLSFAAELRLPLKFSARDRTKRVDDLLETLKLEACANGAIGGEGSDKRGISGGERRRLSVGLSLIGGLPQLLLCDEPTTGLDSASASLMVALLQNVAGRGVTVVCAIHQPSFAVFQEFKSLLLLEAGRVMFSGSVVGEEGVEHYFASHGKPTPEHVNPAHHYIQEIQEHGDAWTSHWWAVQATASAPDTAVSRKPRKAPPARKNSSRSSHLGLWRQTEILTRRTMLENFKNKRKFFKGIMSRMPASAMIGLFFWRIAAEWTQESIFPVKGVVFLSVQNPLIDAFYAGATTFQMTRGLLKREYYEGLYHVTPFYLSYYIGFLAMQIPWTFVWVLPMYLLVGLPLEVARFGIFFLASFLVILMSCAAGSYVGTRTGDQDGNRAVLMPMLIPMALFSGYVIPLAQIPWAWRFIYFLSPLQWGTTILETSLYQGAIFTDCDATVPKAERHCYATGDELLEATTSELARSLGVRGMVALYAAYIALFLLLNVRAIKKHVLDGRV